MTLLVIMYVLVAVLLGVLLMWVRNGRIFTGVYAAIILGLVVAGGQLLGEPRPITLDIFKESSLQLLHEEYREGTAIYLTVLYEGDLSPDLIVLPWNMEQVKQLRSLRKSAGNDGEGGRLMMRRNVDHEGGGERMFYLDVPSMPPPKPQQVQPNTGHGGRGF